MRMLLTLLLGLTAAYVLVVVLAVLFQNRLVFFPDPVLVATPQRVGLPHETIMLATSDGEQLHGWWMPVEAPRGTLLFFHGNAGNISHRLASVEVFHRLGLNVLIFDYRGYGRSTGRPSEGGLYRDAEAAWRYLTQTRGLPPERIVVFGRSLGGGPASWLAAEHPPAALILESAFTSVPDVARHHYPWLPTFLASTRFDTLARIRGLGVPLLVIHSPHDEVIPYEHGQRLFEAAPGPKQFLEITGGHNDGFAATGRAYRDGLDAFLRVHLP